ncbi:MAG: type II toxin-antitoxin system HicA family toxin [Lachnospiraceae bacterium]|nr:type II toxin-antitoxin system HicA family toxin [Lachnospiraceae bacterium]
MARAKEYSFREFRLLLKNNGYSFERMSGDHYIYTNGVTMISVPDHGKKLNRMVCRRLIKENNLK